MSLSSEGQPVADNKASEMWNITVMNNFSNLINIGSTETFQNAVDDKHGGDGRITNASQVFMVTGGNGGY